MTVQNEPQPESSAPVDSPAPPADPPTWVLAFVGGLVAIAGLLWLLTWWTTEPSPDKGVTMSSTPPVAEEAPSRVPTLEIRESTPDVPVFLGVPRAEAEWVVLGVGDSWMAGDDAPTGASYLAVLGRLVHESSGKAVHVHNLGSSGTNSGQAWLSLMDSLPSVRPDLLVVTTGVHDLANTARQGEIDAALAEKSSGPGVAGAQTQPASYEDLLTTSPLFEFWRMGDFAAGAAQVDEERDLSNADRAAWRALFLYGEGLLDEAWAAAIPQLGTEDEPGHPLALLTLGLVDYRHGRTNRGSLYLSQLATAEPSWFRDLGLTLWSIDRGHHELAKACSRRALAQTPTSPEAQWAAWGLPEEARDPEFEQMLERLPAPRPAAWNLIVEARRTSELPPGLETLPTEDGARRLIETIVGHRKDELKNASEVAATLGRDPRSPRWLRAEALAQAVRSIPASTPEARVPLRLQLHEDFADVPLALMAQLEMDWEKVEHCDQRLETGRLALQAGGNVVEVLTRLGDCAAPGVLEEIGGASVVTKSDGLPRVWAERVRTALLDESAAAVDEVDLTRRLHSRLDAMLNMAADHGVPMVVVNYAYPDDQHAEVNRRLEAWATMHESVIYLDVWSSLRGQLDDEGWKARTTFRQLDGEGYRLMGVSIFEELTAAGLVPKAR